MDPDVVEQRAGRLGEVVTVGREALDSRLARPQHSLVAGDGPARALGHDYLACQLPIDGATEAVHVVSLTPLHLILRASCVQEMEIPGACVVQNESFINSALSAG